MVAAILRAADQAWFLKAAGPIAAIDAVRPPLAEFLRGVRVDDGRPVWDLPDGWSEKPAAGMRLATIVAPGEGDAGDVEISVIGLPLAGAWDAQVRDNVNRWRKQLGLAALAPAESGSSEGGLVLFDEAGRLDTGGMTPPFAAANRQPPASPPAAPAAPPSPGADELTFDTPDGWIPRAGSAIRKASLATESGVEITAFAFPTAAPAMADPLANVNRWRGEIGLGPIDAAELDAAAESMTLAGRDATFFRLEGEEQTTLAAMTERGDRVWFFKLRGPGDAALAELEAFRAWLASIEIND